MKLIGAELMNFCQFRYLQARFAPGLTAIVGRNGSGKSNLVKAIYAAVTGDFGRNDGVKTDNISQFAAAGEPSKINVTLEHGTSTLDITRSLRPPATRLKIESNDTTPQIVTKTQEATDVIFNTLGVSSRMLADYVFVDQWSIFDFLSMMPAERAKAFQRLFRTERAEALWKLIGEHYDEIIIQTPGIDKDAVTKRLWENRAKLDVQEKALSDLKFKQKFDFTPDTYKVTLDNWNKLQTVNEDIDKLSKIVPVLDADLAKLTAEVDKLKELDEELTATVTEQHEQYILAKQHLSSISTYEAVEGNRKKLHSLVDSLAAQEADLVKPVRPPVYIGDKADKTYEEWWSNYTKLDADICVDKHFIESISDDMPFCPTCGTPTVSLQQQREMRKVSLATNQQRLANMTGTLEASSKYLKELVSYNRTLSDIKRERTQLLEQISQLAVVPKPDKSREELLESISIYETLINESKQTKHHLHDAELRQQRLRSSHEQVVNDLNNKSTITAKLSVTQEEADHAQTALNEFQKISQEITELTFDIKATTRLTMDDEKTLVHLAAVEEEAEIERKWSDHCLEMRHVTHRDNWPRLVAHNYLELMQDEINNLLIRFDSPFQVTADESLSFMAAFKDGRKVPAARLSGGEKVLLALAFRVTVNDIFAKDLGLLVLDEPTAGLDEGNLACLKIAVSRLKELSSARGLQVIMITHEHELHSLFDHVVEIG